MIYLGSDHAGYELKKNLCAFLEELGTAYADMGPLHYDAQDDYPDYILPTAQQVAQEPGALGIVIGGSGQGEAYAANKVKGVRAALYYGGPREIITLSKTHNNANVLSLGARFVTETEAREVLQLWLETQFTGEERHQRRLDKVARFEGEN